MRTQLPLTILAAIMASLLFAMSAQAQATRTWVSGVGDDSSTTCSRTAPCQTFSTAINKTAAFGEINCLDAGGFGAVTITKSIVISCEVGTAGVLVPSTYGIVVDVTATDTVVLRGLDIEGFQVGLSGILFNGGGTLQVDKCLIRLFNSSSSGYGINFVPNDTASLVIQDSTIASNGDATSSVGGGVHIAPVGGITTATLDNVKLLNNTTFGLRVEDNAKVTVNNSVASGSGRSGFAAVSGSAPAVIELLHSTSANNGANGVNSSGVQAQIRMAYTGVFDNGTGINASEGGTVTSFTPGTNPNAGNTTPGAPNGSAIGLQ
ncbi:MAG TPA: right-handed parallel beta-helix repeat-containing protein [Xanthobacteraceae bacterium]|jgi:hypothetical protein|nr:right-handed parallel beta-helix repeat-containing protein [Xanthobacteraceae bacterium]